MDQLPEKWAIKLDCQEVVDYANEYGFAPPYVKNEGYYAHFPNFVGGTTCCVVKKGYVEITIEDFRKLVLKNSILIGYKLVKPEFEKAVIEIINNNHKFWWESYANNCFKEYGYHFAYNENIDNKSINSILKKSGVLDLWFEPVYEMKYKIGDWITILNYDSEVHSAYNKTFQIEKLLHGKIWDKNSLFPISVEFIRKATLTEIKKLIKCVTLGSFGSKFEITRNKIICEKLEIPIEIILEIIDKYSTFKNSFNKIGGIIELTPLDSTRIFEIKIPWSNSILGLFSIIELREIYKIYKELRNVE